MARIIKGRQKGKAKAQESKKGRDLVPLVGRYCKNASVGRDG
jgi:hypothetical protein